MSKLRILVSDQFNPYINVAVENYLLGCPADDTLTLYLWQNRRTVVIGQNQNPFSECNLDQLLADGGYLMRRRTGGGAVYHDDGNLNFSFLIPHDTYSVERQFAVIAAALKPFGLETETSGRNDMLCQGRKFSGNAFAVGENRRLHHGTLLIAGNMDDLKRYLKVKPSKLVKHGVGSVQGRVINISELNQAITANSIKPHLISAFQSEYGQVAETLDFHAIANLPEVKAIIATMSSDEWLYGRWHNFEATRSAQFEWGNVDISLSVDSASNTIQSATIATDALNTTIANRVAAMLTGQSTLVRPHTNDDAENDILDLIYN